MREKDLHEIDFKYDDFWVYHNQLFIVKRPIIGLWSLKIYYEKITSKDSLL